MGKQPLIAFAAGTLLAVLVMRSLQTDCEPWKPVLEETSFRHLSDQVEALDLAVERTAAGLGEGRAPEAREALATVQEVLTGLRVYYVPLTEVRQLAYDADRLFFLGEVTEAVAKLRQARDIVHRIGGGRTVFSPKVADSLVLMIESAILAVEDRSDQVVGRLRDLGHKVNLLLLRGELEL
jgi:hypothetical protein